MEMKKTKKSDEKEERNNAHPLYIEG